MASVADLQREVSLGLLRSSVGYAVRTPTGQKEPGHYTWDPRANSPEISARTLKLLETTNDNLGIHLFGPTVDVDVDSDNPHLVPALDHFLPHTAHIWGRKSRPRTHRLYELSASLGDPVFTPEQFHFLQALKKHESVRVEIRGGELKNGQYSLLPGSLHPSGEIYEWADLKAARSTPVAVDIYRLVNAVRFACVAALVLPYWTEGNRNSLCMAVSGFFHRAASHVADMGANAYLNFEKQDALSILDGIMELADDDPEDRASRLKTFEKTWEKADGGGAVQGGTTIAKITGDEKILQTLYALLADTPDLIAFDEFLDRYAVRNNTSNVIDLHKAGYRNAPFIMSVQDFRNSHMHRTLTTSSGARSPMTNILLASSRAIRVDGMAFVPGGEQIIDRWDGKYVNQWRGWAIEPAMTATLDDVKPFTEYVENILANGVPVARDWVMAWLADVVQNPATKPGTALVLVGKPGSGKSFLGNQIMRRLIGSNHSMQTNNAQALTGNFNADSANQLWVQCDEAMNSRRRQDANQLKSMITDPTRRIEPKGVNAYEVEDCARYCFTSNDVNDAIAIIDGQDDRRYTVLHVNEDYAHRSSLKDDVKKRFWNRMVKWTDDPANLALVHRYLLDYQYERDLIRSPLDTAARRIIQQHSQRGLDDWLMMLVNYEHPLENMRAQDIKLEECFVYKNKKLVQNATDWPELIAYSRLEASYELYRRHKALSATTPTYNAQQIKHEFMVRGLLPKEPSSLRYTHNFETWANGEPTQSQRKLRLTEFPSKERILDYLRVRLGYDPMEEREIAYEIEDEPASRPTPEY